MRAREYVLAPDSVVLLYTDGITDFDRNLITAELALTSAARILAADVTIAEPARFVKDVVMGSFEPNDDVAILTLQMTAVDTAASARDRSLTKSWRFHSSHPLSAHNARREVARYLSAFASETAAVSDAELVIGELLANTVEHAPGLVEVCLDWRETYPTVVVRDSGRGGAIPPPVLPDANSEDGRGLFLVYALADDVFVTETPTVGTEISCRLRLTRAEHRLPARSF